MNPGDRKDFFALVANVYGFYRQEMSEFAGSVWWEAMAPFDIKAVRAAFTRHAMNPDSGQFLPKPADVMRMLQGGTADQAATAWAKVDRALRIVGPWQDVAFDDALIHRCVAELGGWAWLGQQTEKEWPFIARRFETLYRGYRMRNELPDYPNVLIGLANAHNAREGRGRVPPLLIGDAAGAANVAALGCTTPLLTVTQAGTALQAALGIGWEAARAIPSGNPRNQ